MAAADFFDITVRGQGSHVAWPHRNIDLILIGTGLAQSLFRPGGAGDGGRAHAHARLGIAPRCSASGATGAHARLSEAFTSKTGKSRRSIASSLRILTWSAA